MAYINVDEVYILDNTGLQVDMATDIPFVDAGFTDTQKAQARKNIGAGSTNPNLLDNPWWGLNEVVNQRGITSATVQGTQRFIDRWLFTYGSTQCSFVIGTNGLEMTVGDNFQCIQAFENPNKLNGRTLTASVMLADGTIYSGTITRVNGTQQVFYNANNVYMNMRTINDFFLRVTANMTVRAVKLELGSVSTLANDAPPDYGTELAKCQYYFRRLYTEISMDALPAMAVTATAADVINWTGGLPMRKANATVTYSGTINVYDGSNHAVTAVGDTVSGSQRRLRFTTTGLTPNTACYIALNGHIDISCDL